MPQGASEAPREGPQKAQKDWQGLKGPQRGLAVDEQTDVWKLACVLQDILPFELQVSSLEPQVVLKLASSWQVGDWADTKLLWIDQNGV